MGTHKTSGFTIIETMLVLAITGLLVAGIFVGVGTQISIQRYRDAVETFKTVLQNQYSEITSVRNDRSDDWQCDGSARTSQDGTTVRGQSDCVLLGRLVTIQGGDIQISPVVGREDASPSGTLNDIDSLRDNYTLNVATNAIEAAELEWGAEIAWPASGTGSRAQATPRSLSLLILRSPDSGQVYTFTSDTVPTAVTPQALRSLIVAGVAASGGQGERIICVSSNDLLVNDDYSLIIAQYAAVPNAIEVSSNGLLATTPRTTRC